MCIRDRDYIVHALVDFDDIDYFTHADLLYDLAGQLVQHLPVSYTHLRAHETVLDLVCRLLLEKKKQYHLPPLTANHAHH